MKHESRGSFLKLSILVAVGIGVALLTVQTILSAGQQSALQDTMRLETRLSQLEQRLYTIENNVRNLEQQSRLGTLSTRGTGQEDVVRLRLEIEMLQRRLADDECALAKLDERTLTREIRDARRRAGATSSDPCRSQVDTPLRLPNRE